MTATRDDHGSGHGSNATSIRLFNERVILATLRRVGQASKADLARHARLTQNAAGQIVRELERQRLVRAGAKRAGRRGQPPTMLTLDAEGAYGIGVKVGRRSLDALLVDFKGRTVDRRRAEADFPLPGAALAFVDEALEALGQGVPAGRIAGLGIATPYNLGAWQRELGMPAPVHAAWNGFDVLDAVRHRTALPVWHENDGTAAALAELFMGRGRTMAGFVYVFIGAATGGGVVLDTDYYRGPSGNAGDIGLAPVPPSGLASAPKPRGGHDILLARASIVALLRHLRAAGHEVPDRDALDRLALEGVPAFAEWRADAVDALVVPVLTAARLLDLPVVVDGDLPRPALARLIEALGEALALASPEAREPPPIVQGTLGRDAGALGAAILPLHLNFRPGAAPLAAAEVNRIEENAA
ncbi:MAG: ROK family protein [Geminicoccaceae bacterium]|nr:ROK family protein [Geminicoccaceae bacterium]